MTYDFYASHPIADESSVKDCASGANSFQGFVIDTRVSLFAPAIINDKIKVLAQNGDQRRNILGYRQLVHDSKDQGDEVNDQHGYGQCRGAGGVPRGGWLNLYIRG